MIDFGAKDIGWPTIIGQEFDIESQHLALLIDAKREIETLVVANQNGQSSNILARHPAGPIHRKVDQYSMWMSLDLSKIKPDAELALIAYVSTGVIGDLLVTLDKPRLHQATRCDLGQAIIIAEIKSNFGRWSYKVKSRHYESGLTEILAKFDL